jgi:hypothetical protein
MLDHLMTKSSLLGKTRHEVRCNASRNQTNAADELYSVTRPAGLYLSGNVSQHSKGVL